MNISVIPTAQQAQGYDFSGKTVVVIDVLRATSVITTALDNGAACVIPFKTIEEATACYATCDPATTLRGGERNAMIIDGFDIGNSPLSYKKDRVGGKTVILTTTNGTNAINNVKGADEVVLACFRNAEAVAKHIIETSQCGSPNGIVIVCAGTEGRFSLDDGLCAGMLIALLKQHDIVDADDLGLLLYQFYVDSRDNLFSALTGCFHLRRLFMRGLYDDIRFCLEPNCVTVVPVVREGKIVKS